MSLLITAPVIINLKAQEPTVPPGGRAVLAVPALAGLRLVGSQAQLATVEAGGEAESVGRFGEVVTVKIRPGATAEWNVQLMAATTADVSAGDVLLATFWARCDESMTGEGAIGVVFEGAKGDQQKAVERRLSVGGDWRQVFVPFRSPADFAAGEAQFCMRLGYDRQQLEIADLRVENYGKKLPLEHLPRTVVSYPGRAADSGWRREADARIERHRKGEIRIEVRDEAGRAVEGARVEVNLVRHAFGFGTCVDANLLMGSSADSQKYREIVEKHFNLTVFENDMKWPAVANGVPPVTDNAVAWLLERGFFVRGHNLVWPSWRWMPSQMQPYRDDPAALRQKTAEHITRTVKHFAGKLPEWDVVNEPYSEHDLIDALGGREILLEWYRLAHEADPACKLYLNDYGIFDAGRAVNEHADHFFETIKFLQDNGAPIHGVGIQSHFSSDLPGPEALLKTLDRFASFGLPIQSTELSINLEDRDTQADYLRDYMTVLFSHPKVEGIMLWGIWSKRHWRPQAALWGDDWAIRPNGQAYVDLLTKTWTTRELLTTDAAGGARARGFFGEYSLAVSVDGTPVVSSRQSLSRDGDVWIVVIP
jgi:GH35 family endo-1,4-beta-xylanase